MPIDERRRIRTKYFSLDRRVAELWQRGRARLGQGLDKLICGRCPVAFRRSPLLSLRRDDGNSIRRTSSFISLDGREYVSLSVGIFVCAADLLAFSAPRGNHFSASTPNWNMAFSASTPNWNMAAVLQTAQSHRHLLRLVGGGVSFSASCGRA